MFSLKSNCTQLSCNTDSPWWRIKDNTNKGQN